MYRYPRRVCVPNHLHYPHLVRTTHTHPYFLFPDENRALSMAHRCANAAGGGGGGGGGVYTHLAAAHTVVFRDPSHTYICKYNQIRFPTPSVHINLYMKPLRLYRVDRTAGTSPYSLPDMGKLGVQQPKTTMLDYILPRDMTYDLDYSQTTQSTKRLVSITCPSYTQSIWIHVREV